MGTRYALGRKAIATCDRCGFQYRLSKLKTLVVKTKNVNLMVCPSCWEQDHPQLMLGMYPVDDPQALRNPRPDTSYFQSGLNANGSMSEGSRVVQWGWQPVGVNNPLGFPDVENALVSAIRVGTVTVLT